MGFLDKLWDETLAGPTPDSGLGKLRKTNSLSAVRSSNHHHHHHHHHLLSAAASRSAHHRDPQSQVHYDQDVRVSRSITILRTKSVDPGSGPSSPTLSSGSNSPMTPGTPRDADMRKFTRKKHTSEFMDSHADPSSSVYDWIMISALDR